MNPAVVIPNKNTTLHADSRGRVRFSFQGYRFEVTKHSVSAYDRRNTGRYSAGELRANFIPVKFLNNRLFMLKLRQAQDIFDV